MGRDSQAACLDCRQRFEFGYGPASTWMDLCSTVAEYDSAALGDLDRAPRDARADLGKNKAWRAFLAQHEAHRFVRWSEDWASEEAGPFGERWIVMVTGKRLANVTGFAVFAADDAGDLRQMLAIDVGDARPAEVTPLVAIGFRDCGHGKDPDRCHWCR